MMYTTMLCGSLKISPRLLDAEILSETLLLEPNEQRWVQRQRRGSVRGCYVEIDIAKYVLTEISLRVMELLGQPKQFTRLRTSAHGAFHPVALCVCALGSAYIFFTLLNHTEIPQFTYI